MNKTTIRETLSRLRAWGVRVDYNRVERLMSYQWGAETAFQTLDVSPEMLRGPEYTTSRIDEGSATTLEHVITQVGRTRRNRGDGKPNQTWIFTNPPKSKNHWLREFVKEPHVKLFCVSTLDNPFLPSSYIDTLSAAYKPGTPEYHAMVLGQFADYYGLAVYPEFNRDAHVIDSLPGHVNFYANGIDFGWVHPFAGVFGAVLHDGTLVIIDEYRESGKLLEQHARALKGKRIGAGLTFSEHDPQVRAELDALGVETVAAEKRHEIGINAVRHRLRTGKLRILRHCTRLISELEGYSYTEEGSDEVLKERDDLADALRYLVAGLDTGAGGLLPAGNYGGGGSGIKAFAR